MPTRFFGCRVLSLAVASTLIGPAVVVPTIVRADNGQTQTGVVKEETYVRSGPAVNKFYATTALPAGSRVTIVGGKAGWYYIAPPEGSFCCVAKGYIQKVENSAIGKVVQPDLRVRAGSSLNNEMSTVLPVRLVEGSTVQIIGEVGEWFKIVPPAGTYLYVEQSSIDIAPTEVAAKPVEKTGEEAKPTKVVDSKVVDAKVVDTTMTPTAAEPTTLPSRVANAVPTTMPTDVAMTPTTQPSGPSADAKFEELENQFVEASNQPLDQQPIDSLLTKYERLTTESSLNPSLSKIATMRAATLKMRAGARDEYAAAQKMQAEAAARRQALKAEQQELADKAKAAEITSYTAVGTLRVSSLQPAGATLYRMTDPSTGRTLMYVRGNDKVVALLNKFVGVRGEIQSDDALGIRTINPTDVEAVDASKVGTTITATEIPSSMTGKTQASVPSN